MKNLKISQFLERLSMGGPIPGGGSASALAGALSASLLCMVANLTTGKSGYEGVKKEVEEIRERAEALRRRLLDAVEEDCQGYEQVISAFRLPKDTEAQRQKRSRFIQEAYKRAAQTPLEVSQISLALLDLCEAMVEKGNISAVSDAGVAFYLADATLRGGLMNVRINLSALTDETYQKATKRTVDEIEKRGNLLKGRIQDLLLSKLANHLR
ncbi:MAG: methenyltetrahydrofolate cyclohydrolase [Proteobacteria bacterium]|nr:methenyltetrahydrofolate cyclohydrolase [Pseudomonadota bacterium]NIS68170.1 methenyltetrahydrofolate cyclohydrolase [Pseudomonadota bacterium]